MEREDKILQEIQEIKEDLKGIRKIIQYQVETQSSRMVQLENQQNILKRKLEDLTKTSVGLHTASVHDKEGIEPEKEFISPEVPVESKSYAKKIVMSGNDAGVKLEEPKKADETEDGPFTDDQNTIKRLQQAVLHAEYHEPIQEEVSKPAQPSYYSTAETPRETKNQDGLEFRIGGIWLNRIAIVLIVLGTAYFLKYAFDNNWVGPMGRIIIGVLFGISFLVAGEIFQNKKYTIFAQGLTGGGLAILYFSIFAGYYFFRDENIISQPVAMVLMIIITAASVILSVRYDSKAIAVLGLIGGFSTPFLLAAGEENYLGLFTYLLILNIGILTLSYYKKWSFLSYISFSLTQLIMLTSFISYFWNIKHMFFFSEFFFTALFIMYLLIPVVYSVFNNTRVTGGQITIIVINTLFYTLVSFSMISIVYPDFRGFFAVLMTLAYGGIGFWVKSRNPGDKNILVIFFGTAITFLTLAIPLQLYKYKFMDLISIGWIIESTILLYSGFKIESRKMRTASIIILLITSTKFLMFDVLNLNLDELMQNTYIPILNKWSIEFIIVTVGLFISAYLYKKNSDLASADESFLKGMLLAIANGFLFIQISMEISNYFYLLSANEGSQAVLLEHEQMRNGLMSISWTVYAITLAYIGFIRDSIKMRYWAIGILAAVFMKLFMIDFAFSMQSDTAYILVFNTKLISTLIAVTAMFSVCCLYKYYEDKLGDIEYELFNPMMITAIVILGIALSVENLRYYDSLGAFMNGNVNTEIQMQFALSSIWAIYSIILIIVGIMKRYKPARIFAIVLFGITIMKIFLSDLSILTGAYRVLSFIVLGFILLAVSFLYQKYKSIIINDLPEAIETDSFSGEAK